MAPVSDRVYFPPLGDCLDGKELVLSWKLIASALTDTSGERQVCAPIAKFLSDEYVHELFRSPIAVFAPDDQRSATAYEGKTASIHVTPNPQNADDLKAVKEHAQWLSKTAGINQVAALRIALIELQSRAESYLQGPLSTQDTASLQDAAGVSNFQASSLLLTPGGATMDADAIQAEFGTETAKKRRVFSTYLAERRFFMMAADHMRCVIRFGRFPTRTPLHDSDIRARYLLKSSYITEYRKTTTAIFQAYRIVLEKCLESIETGLDVEDETLRTEGMSNDYNRTIFIEVLHALSVIFQELDHPHGRDMFAPPGVIMSWFKVMNQCAFLAGLHDDIVGADDLTLPIKTLVCAITLKLLTPMRTVDFLSDDVELDADEEPYVASSSLLDDIHTNIVNVTTDGNVNMYPVSLAWCVILHRMYVSFNGRAESRDDQQHAKSLEGLHGELRLGGSARRTSAGSIISLESKPLDAFLQKTGLDKDMQPVEQVAMVTTQRGKVYDVVTEMAACFGSSVDACFPRFLGSRVRATFIDFMKACYPLVGYQSDPVIALLTVISGQEKYQDAETGSLSRENDAAAVVLEDPAVLGLYQRQSMSRYPVEFLPFIGFCRALCGAASVVDRADLIANMLRQTPTLTFGLPETFQQYELKQDDENSNAFRTLVNLPIFTPRTTWGKRTLEHDSFQIPAGSSGRFVTDSGRVVLMDYEHSGLALIGALLEVSLAPETYEVLIGTLGTEEIGDTVSMLAHLVRAERLRHSPQAGIEMLDEISRTLSGGRDIISVVCEMLDTYMQDDALEAAEGPAVSVLTSCIDFLDAALPLSPTRVWSYMARCQLLGSESQAGRLGRITGNLELVAERYDFLLSSLRFFSGLVDSAFTSAVQRRCGYKASSRNKEATNLWVGIAEKIMTKVGLAIAQTAVDVFENSSTWRMGSEPRRMVLIQRVVDILGKLTTFTYGMGDPEKKDGLVACLQPAAAYVIECFLSPASGSLRFQPFLATLMTALQSSASTVYLPGYQSIEDALGSVLGFSTLILRVANYVGKPASILESHLFKVSPLLARLCTNQHGTTRQVLLLLEALVISAGKSTSEPPSLLGYLGPQLSQPFLRKLSQLDKPFSLDAEVKTGWEFFSAIVRNRQQWMTNCLLTGMTPREALKGEDKITETSSNSLLATAFARLKLIDSLSSHETLAILDFVTSAQNYWPWTTFTMEKDPSFLDSLRGFVRSLPASAITARASDASKAATDAKIAASIAEAFAMQLFHLRQMGKADVFAKQLLADLDYYLREGVDVSGYNSSLHSNFAKNFSAQYPGCSLDDFKRTLVSTRSLGGKYFYDLDSADKMLALDSGWHGASGRNNGFRNEMERANQNLSLVDAQISLFHAWEFLLLEFSSCMPNDKDLARRMLQVAQRCLDANLSSQGPENIFVRLIQARANLALALVQRLVGSSPSVGDINLLLGTLSSVIHGVEEPFGPNSVSYYRTLLRILFVTLRAYVEGERRAATAGKAAGLVVTMTQTVLGYLDRVVAKGFRELVTLIHDPEASVSPEDIELITAILQACLAVPGMDQCQAQIQNIMASYDAMHVATSLFSWADKLAVDGDPIYGELSLLFLLELSTLPRLAEQLACDGLLGQLTSASLASYMRRPVISPFADAPGPQRCYGIWARGMLPLLLNLLAALGATVAPEVAYVLNQFPHLLAQSVDRLEAPGASRTASSAAPHRVALLAVEECRALALLTRVLGAFRAGNGRDVPAVEWEAAAVLENVEFWLGGRKLLRDRLLPLGRREVEWRNTRAAAEGSVLEEKVVAQLECIRDVLSEDVE